MSGRGRVRSPRVLCPQSLCPALCSGPRGVSPPPPALTAPWTLTFLRGGQRGPAPGLALRASAPGAWWTGPFSLAAVPDGAPQDPAVAHRGGAEAAGAQPRRRRALHEGERYAPGRGGWREPRPDPGSPPAASSRSTETGSTQSTWSAFRACSVSCHRPRLCGRGLAAVSGSLRSGSPPACGARARRCAQGPWRTPLPPGPCPGLTGAVSRPQRCWTRTRTSGWTRRPCGSLRRWAFPRAGPRRPSG